MASDEHLGVFRQGIEVWNKWRGQNTNLVADLSDTNFSGASLEGVDFVRVDLSRTNLSNANLRHANFNRANLLVTDLSGAKLNNANFVAADLSGTELDYADLRGADFNSSALVHASLRGANLNGADFTYTYINAAHLEDADISNALICYTTFSEVDLTLVKGLENTRHRGPSSIGIDTIYMSKGRISEKFLRSCGVPDEFIVYMHSLAQQPIQFHSCFISYSTMDEEFARRLYSRMRDEHLRVWFAPEDIKGGQKLHEQIERAIQIHDRLLLVLSENSMQSEWVMTEIRNARKVEFEENRRKLFPIRLVGFDTIRKWKCFDSEMGKDLAVELREYFIPDFSNWKDHDAFEKAFERLLSDLKAEEST